MALNLVLVGPAPGTVGHDGAVDVDSPASRTALGAARHRATHQLLENGVVLTDPLAVPILGESETELRQRDSDLRMRLFVCARQRYAEHVLADAVARGVDQLVVLGAGLDTFGYRSPYDGLRVIELDHPATQAWKRQRLAEASIEIPGSVTHAPIDFERDQLLDVLGRQVDLTRPVLCWWLGVTPYLTVAAITATLTTLGSLPHSAVVLDHGAPNPDADPETRAWMQARAARVASLGEPWISRFAPEELLDLLRGCGFEDARAVDEVALIRRWLGRRPPPERRVTHLALATAGWPSPPTGGREP
jgi:methyltransferase (TIGR00027 family)